MEICHWDLILKISLFDMIFYTLIKTGKNVFYYNKTIPHFCGIVKPFPLVDNIRTFFF
jgi:hypothetical protein